MVAPHPDDETIGTGELIQHVRRAGGSVRVLLLTSGDDNPWPQRWLERRLWIGPGERRRWGERRRGEVARALRTLDLAPDALRMMGWPDMGVTARLRAHHGESLQLLQRELEDWQPSLIALPALGDRHPDHGSAHVLMRLALARTGRPSPPLLGYLVHGRTEPDAVPVQFPAAPELHAIKLAALQEHRSQMALSGRRMRGMADRPERFTLAQTVSSTEAVLPWRPAPLWQPRLRLLLANGERVHSWPWSRAPLERTGDGFRLAAGRHGGGPQFAKLTLEVSSPWIFDRWGWCEL